MMTGIPKRLRIAVVGERASGKSYLLYDLIHAFGLLGYQPEELPLKRHIGMVVGSGLPQYPR